MASTSAIQVQEQLVHIPMERITLEGSLTIPDEAHGVVIFAHGSGSSRHSPRNRAVAQELQQGHLATLLIDLLTATEEQEDLITGRLRFDVPLLADRLVAAMEWLSHQPHTRDLPIGVFGASTGGGAALVAASHKPELVRAVVSRGGRPDLAGDALPHVHAPTLLIVGGRDTPVISMNQSALDQLRCEKRLQIILGATHLFVEPGTLDEVARLAREWFEKHLTPAHV